ncbi:hypothetical protein SAMN04515617_1473 [Collimonas sp. OK242]|nr:hypothetical protein SAMN04515617_1473 [Collimonas sp. OK242]
MFVGPIFSRLNFRLKLFQCMFIPMLANIAKRKVIRFRSDSHKYNEVGVIITYGGFVPESSQFSSTDEKTQLVSKHSPCGRHNLLAN